MVGAFARDQRGNFAIFTALLMVPVLFSIGAAVDMGIFYRNEKQVQSALDAAALAAAKQFPLDSDPARLEAYARSYFDANTASLYRATSVMTYEGTDWTSEGTRELKVSACSLYTPIFFPIMEIEFKGLNGSACAESESVVVVGSTTVEVAMVLDTSGSMNDAPDAGGAAKITTLRSVASTAVNSLFGSGTSVGVDPVQVAIVPFSGGVNVGKEYLDAWWMDPKGQSSIHHENFDWTTYKTPITGLPLATKSLLYPGAWTLTANPLQFLTRQYVYKSLASASTGGSDWAYKGCVESRPDSFGITDEAPSTSKPDSMFVPYFAPDESDGLNTTWTNSYITDSTTGAAVPRMKDMNKYFAPNRSKSISTNYHFSPSWLCDSASLLPLSTNKATVLSKVSALTATGSTNVAQGVEWGWHVLSKNEPFTTGRASGNEKNIKAMIVMTDGEHTYYNDTNNTATANPNLSAFGAYGFTATNRIFDYKSGVSTAKTAANYTTAMDGRLAAICENAKNDGRITLTTANGTPLVDEKGQVKRDGVIIYTIAFDIPPASQTRVNALLKGCASYKLGDLRTTNKNYADKAKYFYSASNASDLSAAFNDIMASLSDLRIAR
ncbi:pilus assembly protein TadG-related protein [Aureimonas sp. AU4]|uniref:TadE/TadG family type IV pilus assembly protein n=1 Tax=Aureimonas sp. AU4 TaxID=1638163 RepID=UPI00178CB734|nr:pilus assembly protein TadG-related protein [Aureimonas sp. AU4]